MVNTPLRRHEAWWEIVDKRYNGGECGRPHWHERHIVSEGRAPRSLKLEEDEVAASGAATKLLALRSINARRRADGKRTRSLSLTNSPWLDIGPTSSIDRPPCFIQDGKSIYQARHEPRLYVNVVVVGA